MSVARGRKEKVSGNVEKEVLKRTITRVVAKIRRERFSVKCPVEFIYLQKRIELLMSKIEHT